MTKLSTIKTIENAIVKAVDDGAEMIEVFVSHRLFLDLLDEVADGVSTAKELARVSWEQRILGFPIYQVHDKTFEGYRIHVTK